MFKKLYYYFKTIWHQYIICDAFLITFAHENDLGEILTTVYGDKIQILWEKEVCKQDYRTYWARPIKQSA